MQKTDITLALNDALNRETTTAEIERHIRASLRELSSVANWPDLKTTASIAVSTGATSLALPAGFRQLDAIQLFDGLHTYEPLGLIAPAALRLERSLSEASGRPVKYARDGRTCKLLPAADGDYTALVDYWRFHPIQEAILFGDEFFDALVELTIVHYLSGLGLDAAPTIQLHGQNYQRKLAALMGTAEERPPVTAYSDL